ncbi:MAG TPA: site-specific DNA-methyltransferase [Tepidisphaeraceae bacterium]|nr:site-specific DNA-methyltransferase [Tepidisphaeraceae bacterium]
MLELDQIHRGDSIKLLNKAEPAWVDLCFADPPFNIGYRYHNYNDRKDVNEYLDFSRQWMSAVHRALKPTGSFYLAIGDEFAADLCVIARRELGFTMRNWIIWHYTFGQQTKKKFALSHTHILYFTKEKPQDGMGNITFNPDAVRVASARQTQYADARANPKGKLPDDVWILRPQEAPYVESSYNEVPKEGLETSSLQFFDANSDTWFISRVCGTFREREGWHGCQMPIGVLDRIIKASSNPGDVVFDPFNGSGTTAVSAALLNRRYVGIDQSAEYVKFAKSRLQHALRARERGKDAEAVVTDAARGSRRLTETDALGRARAPRVRGGRESLPVLLSSSVRASRVDTPVTG